MQAALESTLLILNHKIKKKSIEVTRDYSPQLPRITAFGSELNQVWTNLLDNAIDAMERGGQVRIRTAREGENFILVEICDNGEGIPPDIASHIYDPFFTTKPVGEGTGLGLDTVYRIVRKHHGDIRFKSVPGDTSFQVRLPLNQPTNGNE